MFVEKRRKSANLTQEKFADRVGVALTVIRKIEQGKTNLNILEERYDRIYDNTAL